MNQPILPSRDRQEIIRAIITIAIFPFLILAHGMFLNFLVFITILSFMINESIMFTSWVGLVNTCLEKSVRAKVYSLSMAVKGIVSFSMTYLIFEAFKRILESRFLTRYIGPMNSLVYFWVFAFVGFYVAFRYRNIRLYEDEKEDGMFHMEV